MQHWNFNVPAPVDSLVICSAGVDGMTGARSCTIVSKGSEGDVSAGSERDAEAPGGLPRNGTTRRLIGGSVCSRMPRQLGTPSLRLRLLGRNLALALSAIPRTGRRLGRL